MVAIATYVFFDLDTSGLPEEELYKTRITELSMVAVKRNHLLETKPGSSPRVQHKLTLCVDPGRIIQPKSSKLSGLTNELLEYESKFTKETFKMVNTFLNVLEKPVCLIAFNGENFDFPIFKNHIEKLNERLDSDLMCADSYFAFCDILEAAKKSLQVHSEVVVNPAEEIAQENEVKDTTQLKRVADNLQIKMINETTPKQQNTASASRHYPRQRRRFAFPKGYEPKESYQLKHVYERLLDKPAVDAHTAEIDCILALECSVVKATDFVKWVDENHRPFEFVNPMTLGVPLGDMTHFVILRQLRFDSV